MSWYRNRALMTAVLLSNKPYLNMVQNILNPTYFYIGSGDDLIPYGGGTAITTATAADGVDELGLVKVAFDGVNSYGETTLSRNLAQDWMLRMVVYGWDWDDGVVAYFARLFKDANNDILLFKQADSKIYFSHKQNSTTVAISTPSLAAKTQNATHVVYFRQKQTEIGIKFDNDAWVTGAVGNYPTGTLNAITWLAGNTIPVAAANTDVMEIQMIWGSTWSDAQIAKVDARRGL